MELPAAGVDVMPDRLLGGFLVATEKGLYNCPRDGGQLQKLGKSESMVGSVVRGPGGELYTGEFEDVGEGYGIHHLYVENNGKVDDIRPKDAKCAFKLDIQDNSLYVLDERLKKIFIIDIRGSENELSKTIDLQSSSVMIDRPVGMGILPQGEVLVSDPDQHCCHLYSTTGEIIQTLGKPGHQGEAPGMFDTPRGVHIDPVGHMLVCDRRNKRVQVFSRKGELYGSLQLGNQGPFPQHLCTNQESLAIMENKLIDDIPHSFLYLYEYTC